MSAWIRTRDAGRLHDELARFILEFCCSPRNFEKLTTKLVPYRVDGSMQRGIEEFVRAMPMSAHSLSNEADIALFTSNVLHEWIEQCPTLAGDQHLRAREFAHTRVGDMTAMLGERLAREKPSAPKPKPEPASSLRNVFMALGSGAQSGSTPAPQAPVLAKTPHSAAKPADPGAEMMQLYRTLVADMGVTSDSTEQFRAISKQSTDTGKLPEGASEDQKIFHHLRMQLDSYIKKACSSYGLQDPGGDPMRTLDTLRASHLVDESSLRIAESIFAVCERVISGGRATVSDYREAMLLYLLYHRGHLGA